MQKLIRTAHDVALGLFVNGVYALWNGELNIPNISLVIISLITMYITNKGKK